MAKDARQLGAARDGGASSQADCCLSSDVTVCRSLHAVAPCTMPRALDVWTGRCPTVDPCDPPDGLARSRCRRCEISTIKRLKRVEANPPDVDPADGWSPYRAGRFLESYGLETRDYHRSFDDWWSEAPSVKLTDRAFADRVSGCPIDKPHIIIAPARRWAGVHGCQRTEHHGRQDRLGYRAPRWLPEKLGHPPPAHVVSLSD